MASNISRYMTFEPVPGEWNARHNFQYERCPWEGCEWEGKAIDDWGAAHLLKTHFRTHIEGEPISRVNSLR